MVVKGADNMPCRNIVKVPDLLRQLDITKAGLATEAIDPRP